MVKKRKHESPCKRSESYLMICEGMFNSPAYRDLKPVDRALLNEFIMIHRPDRNGYLSISTRDAMNRLNVGQDAAVTAFYNLESHGFIKLTMNESYSMRLAREWRLTFREAYNKHPSHEWRKWKKDKPYPTSRKKRKSQKQAKRVINLPIHQTTTDCSDPVYTNEQNNIRKLARNE